jgi:hypothetical protein
MNGTVRFVGAVSLVVPAVAFLDAFSWMTVTMTRGPAWLFATLVGLAALGLVLTVTVLVWLTKSLIKAVHP